MHVVQAGAGQGDESQGMAALFAKGDTALITDMASVEIWITLVECNTRRGAGRRAPMGVDYETFAANLTAVWQVSAELFWAIHSVGREANPQWNPVEEGNGWSAWPHAVVMLSPTKYKRARRCLD